MDSTTKEVSKTATVNKAGISKPLVWSILILLLGVIGFSIVLYSTVWGAALS